VRRQTGIAATREIRHGRSMAFIGLIYLFFKGRKEENKESR